MKKEMLTVKVKFNFEGIKYEAEMSVYPEYIGRDLTFIEFLQRAYKKAVSKYKKKNR